MVREFVDARRKMISVANLVQRLSFRGNGISVRASRTEVFPADWSPQTTNWGSERMLSRPHFGPEPQSSFLHLSGRILRT